MKLLWFFLLILFSCSFISCKKEIYSTNGETIYRTGKNNNGEPLLNKHASQIKAFKSCQGCHGKNGNRTSDCKINYKALTDSNLHTIPYNDYLIFRFLDEDLKSDGSIAKTGVKWNISDKDKKDLVEFLKTL